MGDHKKETGRFGGQTAIAGRLSQQPERQHLTRVTNRLWAELDYYGLEMKIMSQMKQHIIKCPSCSGCPTWTTNETFQAISRTSCSLCGASAEHVDWSEVPKKTQWEHNQTNGCGLVGEQKTFFCGGCAEQRCECYSEDYPTHKKDSMCVGCYNTCLSKNAHTNYVSWWGSEYYDNKLPMLSQAFAAGCGPLAHPNWIRGQYEKWILRMLDKPKTPLAAFLMGAQEYQDARNRFSKNDKPEQQRKTSGGKATKFTKFDDNKPRPDLIPPEFLMEMGRVMKNGLDKYGLDNWKLCEDLGRYKAAMARHYLEYMSGVRVDKDSGHATLAHLACSTAMAFGLEKILNDKILEAANKTSKEEE